LCLITLLLSIEAVFDTPATEIKRRLLLKADSDVYYGVPNICYHMWQSLMRGFTDEYHPRGLPYVVSSDLIVFEVDSFIEIRTRVILEIRRPGLSFSPLCSGPVPRLPER